ncbi:hypothetical protein NQ315_004904 [Exocentrus adspersus]|uniref:NADH dehydrogenase (Ubiquinone) complex I, assembly factor 6 n=1 Tax=Exocentrus adspersus TaxID=1586481 RepID=A0AAV8W2R6_9CUCU|nr:hypothetical protein NQ315_004904 [Exocentrus adspersus]
MNNFGWRCFLNVKDKNITAIRKRSHSSAEYVLESVKKYDYENFICTILLQNNSRSCAFAIRGFNVEVARVAEQVSQEMIGSMRYKFWEDMIEKCFTGDLKIVPKHPVAVELFKALQNNKLSKRYLRNLVTSRKNYLNLKGFNNLEEMENYAEHTVSNVLYLVLEGCGVRNINADHAASHLGKAQGIVQQLRSIPFSRRINFLPVPQDILVKNSVSQEEVLRGKGSDRLNECIFQIACQAHQHLMKARNLKDNIPKEGRAALLPAVPVFIYLDRLQKVNYDVFHPSLNNRSWKLLPVLWYSNLRNTY